MAAPWEGATPFGTHLTSTLSRCCSEPALRDGNPFPFPTPSTLLGVFGSAPLALGRRCIPFPPTTRLLSVPSGSAPVNGCPFSQLKMYQNAGFCAININYKYIFSEVRHPNSCGGRGNSYHTHSCAFLSKAGALPLF